MSKIASQDANWSFIFCHKTGCKALFTPPWKQDSAKEHTQTCENSAPIPQTHHFLTHTPTQMHWQMRPSWNTSWVFCWGHDFLQGCENIMHMELISSMVKCTYTLERKTKLFFIILLACHQEVAILHAESQGIE